MTTTPSFNSCQQWRTQEFPKGGGGVPILVGGGKFVIIFAENCEEKTNWTERGRASLSPPSRSATDEDGYQHLVKPALIDLP